MRMSYMSELQELIVDLVQLDVGWLSLHIIGTISHTSTLALPFFCAHRCRDLS